jgi:hypothetical protein
VGLIAAKLSRPTVQRGQILVCGAIYRLERKLPGGSVSHWVIAPFHGAPFEHAWTRFAFKRNDCLPTTANKHRSGILKGGNRSWDYPLRSSGLVRCGIRLDACP